MEIHGKELESHDNGSIIYYDNILIKSVTNPKINEYSTFDDLAKYIEENPDFCGCQYHPMMKGHCKQKDHE